MFFSFYLCRVYSHVSILCWTLHESELPIKESTLKLQFCGLNRRS